MIVCIDSGNSIEPIEDALKLLKYSLLLLLNITESTSVKIFGSFKDFMIVYEDIEQSGIQYFGLAAAGNT